MAERVLFFGDIIGVEAQNIRPFMETARCLHGGSFPSHEEGLHDTSIVEKTRRLLAEVGIPDPSPIVICDSTQERVEQILQICNLRRRQYGEGLYLVIDNDPYSLAEAAKLIVANGNFHQAEILKSVSVIKLGAGLGSDHVDEETGLRVTCLPHPLNPFPTHPTLAS